MTTEVVTTEASGNTNPSSLRSRAFQFTLNETDKYEGLKNEFQKLKTCDYFLAAKELAPTTGHEHIHIYVHFSQPYRLSKKITGYHAHCEICRGSPKQNIDYIKKDGNILDEIGEPPHQGYAHTVKELKELDIDEIDPHMYRIKKDIDSKAKDEETFMNMLNEIEKDELKAPKIIYITGGTGKGKTYGAYKRALKDFKKEDIGKITLKREFFDIINENAKCFVIEEFRSSQITATDFLQLTDKYGYRANIKGGFVTLRPECIIICSIIKPQDLYKDEEITGQFLRRITETIDLDINESL